MSLLEKDDQENDGFDSYDFDTVDEKGVQIGQNNRPIVDVGDDEFDFEDDIDEFANYQPVAINVTESIAKIPQKNKNSVIMPIMPFKNQPKTPNLPNLGISNKIFHQQQSWSNNESQQQTPYHHVSNYAHPAPNGHYLYAYENGDYFDDTDEHAYQNDLYDGPPMHLPAYKADVYQQQPHQNQNKPVYQKGKPNMNPKTNCYDYYDTYEDYDSQYMSNFQQQHFRQNLHYDNAPQQDQLYQLHASNYNPQPPPKYSDSRSSNYINTLTHQPQQPNYIQPGSTNYKDNYAPNGLYSNEYNNYYNDQTQQQYYDK